MINAANMNIPLAGMSVADAAGAAERINTAQQEINRVASFSEVLNSARAVENNAAKTVADMEIARAEAEGRFSRAMLNPQPTAGTPDMAGAGSAEMLKDLASGTASIMDRANIAMKNAADAQRLRKEQEQKRYEKKVREACQGFETMFLSMMYRQMRATVPDNTLFGNSNSQKIWQSMLDDSMMEQVSKSGGVGLADMIYKQLTLRKQI